MGPREKSRGKAAVVALEDALGKRLQWGRAKNRAESPLRREHGINRLVASMGPREKSRGKAERSSSGNTVAT